MPPFRKHNPRCAIFNNPPTLQSEADCNCGAIDPLPENNYDSGYVDGYERGWNAGYAAACRDYQEEECDASV